MIGTRHEEYTHFENNLPFLLQIDIQRNPRLRSRAQNWHENIEIQLCTDGEGEVLLDGERYPFCKGDCVVVNSNVIHYTDTVQSLSYTCLIISADFCRQMGIAYDRLQFSPHLRDKKVCALLEQISDVYRQQAYPMRTATLHVLLLSLLIHLVNNHATQSMSLPTRERVFQNVKAAICYIREHYACKLSLEEIARAACTDKFALCRDFKKITGQTIVTYINQYRCQQAAGFLESGYTVTLAADACGFHNLSFFTATFKKYMGAPPSKYKES